MKDSIWKQRRVLVTGCTGSLARVSHAVPHELGKESGQHWRLAGWSGQVSGDGAATGPVVTLVGTRAEG